MDPDNLSDDDEPAFIGTDVLEVIDIEPRPDDELAADQFDEMEMGGEGLEGGEDMMAGAGGEVGIVPEQDDAAIVFAKHSDAVLALDLDPVNGALAVSGGQDDKAFVWKVATGDVLFECTGHEDSVNCVGFSSDGALIATADMKGLIKVWASETGKQVWTFEVSEVEWLHWHMAAPVLLVGTTEGDVWMWKIPSEEFKTFPGTGSKCTVGEFLADGKRACVGYDDGSVRVWDLKAGTAQISLTPGTQGHQSTVTCVACHHNNRLILTGSTDLSALLINAQIGKVLARLDCRSPGDGGEDEDDSIEAVGFSRSHNYAATGTVKGVLTVWDLTSQTPRYQLHHKDGVVKLIWDPLLPRVHACSLDGCVYAWDALSGALVHRLQGHRAYILDMALSRDGKVVVSASDDQTVRVFNVRTGST